MTDLPDYRREIVIVQSVELDIVGSATVDLIKVDGVDIATPTVTACVPVSIENDAIAYDGVNDRFTIDIEKWSATDTVDVEIQNTTLAVTQSGTWNIGTITSITNTVNVAIASSVTITVTGTVAISGTVAVTQSGTWNIATLTTITNTVTVTGTVAISGTVTISGAVTVTSGAVTVSTSGGINMFIDLLTQTAYKMRYSTISNDNEVTTPTAPPLSTQDKTVSGKFFPCGCRGIIRTLQVYCKRTSTGTITLAYAPRPCDSAVGSVTITPSADWDWKSTDILKMWKHGGMFLWCTNIDADVLIGRDSAAPADAFYTADGGLTWALLGYRNFIRVTMAGQTVCDVPVIGDVALSDRSTYDYKHCAADTQVKAAYGRLHTITINSCTTAGTVTVYDNTAESGTVLAAIALALNMVPVTLTYDVKFATGLYVGYDASVAADLTVSYI